MIREMLPWVKLTARRRDFLAEREKVNLHEDAFMEKVGTDCSAAEKKVVLALRRVIAKDCGIPPEKLDPSESKLLLASLMGGDGFWGFLLCGPYGFDFWSIFSNLIMHELPKEFKQLPNIKPRQLQALGSFLNEASGFSDWIRDAARQVVSVMQQKGYSFSA